MSSEEIRQEAYTSRLARAGRFTPIWTYHRGHTSKVCQQRRVDRYGNRCVDPGYKPQAGVTLVPDGGASGYDVAGNQTIDKADRTFTKSV